jgi:tetratricopeptide (TPR) repeat protein
VGALFLVLLGAGAYGAWSEYRASREQKATNLLFELQGKARAFTEQKNAAEVEKVYQPLFQEFPRSRAAFEARLQLGDLLMDGGNFDGAVEQFKQAEDYAQDGFSRLLVQYSQGVAYESAGKWQEAAAAYEKALSVSGVESLRPEILMAQARCYEALDQADKAVALYKAVQEKFANRSYYSGAASAFEKQLSANKKL